MDLLFKRYASPFVLMDEMISASRFQEFVNKVVKISNSETEDKTMWEYFLHKVYDKTFSEFMKECKQPEVKQEEFDPETTIQKSKNILNGFNLKV